VTFAVLLACALLAVSAIHGFREALRALGTPWLVVLLIPSVLIALLAKNEKAWIPEEARRKFWARSIVVVSVMLCVAFSWIKSALETSTTDVRMEDPSSSGSHSPTPAPRPRGPSGK
jgi:hypothetical protein